MYAYDYMYNVYEYENCTMCWKVSKVTWKVRHAHASSGKYMYKM